MGLVYFFIILFCITHVNPENRPNIVLIIADDMGWNDVGFHGSNQIPTPNIDALAYNGIILNRFYTHPICTPSRAALLTGQYPIRLGLQGFPILGGENRYIPLEVSTLPEELKKLGYNTNLIGKWHLGSAYKKVTPTGRGFDYHFGYWNGYINYFDHVSEGEMMYGFDMHENLKPSWNTRYQYATSLFTRKAREVILSHNFEKPLFLMLSHLAAHTGLNGSLEVLNVEENNRKFGYIENKKRRLYAGIIDELDKSVGEVVQALFDKGVLNDTIIFFFSDNGGQTQGLHENYASNWPLRGMKCTVTEGGVRTVSAVYYSKFRNKGIVNNELFHISDIMPTLYSAAGGNIDHLGKMDGIDQWNSLNNGGKSKRSEILIHIDEMKTSSALLSENGRYKLINGSSLVDGYDGYFGENGRNDANLLYDFEAVIQSPTNQCVGNKLTKQKLLQIRSKSELKNCRTSLKKDVTCISGELCLYDIFEDPCETNNLVQKYPDIANKLSIRLQEFWKQLKPQLNTSCDRLANPVQYHNVWTTWMDEREL